MPGSTLDERGDVNASADGVRLSTLRKWRREHPLGQRFAMGAAVLSIFTTSASLLGATGPQVFASAVFGALAGVAWPVPTQRFRWLAIMSSIGLVLASCGGLVAFRYRAHVGRDGLRTDLSADVRGAPLHEPLEVGVGDATVLTLRVANRGSTAVHHVSAGLTVPEGVAFKPGSVYFVPAFEQALGKRLPFADPVSRRVELGRIEAGSEVSLNMTVSATAKGRFTVTGSVRSEAGAPSVDTVLLDVSSDSPLSKEILPKLSGPLVGRGPVGFDTLVRPSSVDPTFYAHFLEDVLPGDELTWSVRYANRSADPVADVHIRIQPAAHMELVAGSVKQFDSNFIAGFARTDEGVFTGEGISMGTVGGGANGLLSFRTVVLNDAEPCRTSVLIIASWGASPGVDEAGSQAQVTLAKQC